jgi:TM2 domain-containing membrane protein YozV
MADTNTDRIVRLIVDSTIDLARPQLEGRVPAMVINTARSGALVAVKESIPFPARLAMNHAVPASTVQVIETTVKDKINMITGSGLVAIPAEATTLDTRIIGADTNTDHIIMLTVDNTIGLVRPLLGDKVPANTFDTVRSDAVRIIQEAIPSTLRNAIDKASADSKKRLIAACLAFFMGVIGAHKYYLGKRGQGIAFTAVVICTFGLAGAITSFIGVIDAIRLLAMSDKTFVEKYAKNWNPMTYGD